MIPIVIAPHPDQPLPACGEGRQSVALAGWGSPGLVSNQADIILRPRFGLILPENKLPRFIQVVSWCAVGVVVDKDGASVEAIVLVIVGDLGLAAPHFVNG
ncbi:hypothetical protein H6G81_14100 [Scytonema hofmannii FACHB-248]|uniref:Peptidase S1 domain-containing protein n=1 Tax=Scytonema hofmannii FACHB-248 TaxID=1842502 RepID=A0ABR8GQC8_9CYAN|nr:MULTISPECIES: hypothetical protein [Nostocales]MBD2605629.1 hypothetical protein [Scytonema hofmannii FACHB-248]